MSDIPQDMDNTQTPDPIKPTSKLLLMSLEEKYWKSHSILREVTIEDLIVTNQSRAYFRDLNPVAAERYFSKRGIDVDSFGDAGDYHPGDNIPFRRIDALMFASKDGSGHHQRTAVEVKISRADFRRDTPEKVRAWRAMTHRFVYLVPAGLITTEDIPDGVGLWYWHAPTEAQLHPGRGTAISHGTITVERKAKVNKDSVPDQMAEGFTSYLAGRASRAEAQLRRLEEGKRLRTGRRR